MFKNATPIIIKALSPIHAGSGRELGIVDMPIQRESHTGIPKIEGSSVKGSLREWTRLSQPTHDVKNLFGANEGNEQAGLIGFSDAKLLFYPIKTLSGIFAYVTCPYLLERFNHEQYVQKSTFDTDKLDKLIKAANSLQNEEAIILGEKDIESIDLDEYVFTKVSENISADIFEGLGLQTQRYCVVINDEEFIEMISLCKEIITRNRIDPDTGTVEDHALFTEEYLPAESILYTLLLENGIKDSAGDTLVEDYIKLFKGDPQVAQIGGNANIGKGIVELRSLEKGGETIEQNKN